MATEKQIKQLWERFSFVHNSSGEDFTVRLMTKQEFDLAIKHLQPTTEQATISEDDLAQIFYHNVIRDEDGEIEVGKSAEAIAKIIHDYPLSTEQAEVKAANDKFLHNHPMTEAGLIESGDMNKDHVIVDRKDWEIARQSLPTPKREDAQERYEMAKLYYLNNYMSDHDYKENALRIAAGLPTAPEGGEG